MLKQFEDEEVDLEPTARETLRTHLVAAHCGHSLASLTAYMLKAQFLKDRMMAAMSCVVKRVLGEAC